MSEEALANDAAVDAIDETIIADNPAAPPLPPAAQAEAAGGADPIIDNAAFDLSPYFNTLIDALHPTFAGGNDNNNNNNNAMQFRSVFVSLLWNGAEQIATAASATFGQQSLGGLGAAAFAVDVMGGQNEHDIATAASFFSPKFAAVYLYAVAQNIVSLEEIVLREASLSGQGLQMDVGDGGISTKQVVEIVGVSVVKVFGRGLRVAVFWFH